MSITKQQLELLHPMMHSKLNNYVWPGFTSSLIGGGCGFGSVRIFENSREQHTDITPHSHRFDFLCLVLQGSVTNKVWYERKLTTPGDEYALFDQIYNHKPGDYTRTTGGEIGNWGYTACEYREGEFYSMKFNEIHSIKFSRNAAVLFFEGPEVTGTSQILLPYVNNEVLETMHVEDWMFQHAKS